MMYMHNYSKNEVVLVRYPFTDLSSSTVNSSLIIKTVGKLSAIDIKRLRKSLQEWLGL